MRVNLKHNVSVFLRDRGNIGHIVNRGNLKNCVFDGIGADFLNALEYKPMSTENLVDEKLMPLYTGVSRDELLSDFEEFIKALKNNGYVDIDKEYDSFQHINIELTNGCNERCVHCYLPNAEKTENRSLAKEEITRIIDEFVELGGRMVTFTGGEALLSPNILLIKYAHEKGLDTAVLSNLTILTDAHIRLFVECNTSVQVSLYSTLPAEQDAITLRRGSCEQTMNAIRRLRSHDISVTISCVLMNENAHAYNGVIKFAKEIGAKVQVSYMLQAQIDGDSSCLSHRIPLHHVKTILRDLLTNYMETLKPVPFFAPKPIIYEEWLHSSVCSACNDSIYITASGDVQPCAGWSMPLGNIKIEKLISISDKIRNAPHLTFTHEMFPQCLKCDASDFCMFCLSINASDNKGNYNLVSSYICELARAYKDVYYELKMK